MMFDPSDRADVQQMFNARTAQQERERYAAESRRRSATEMAQGVAEEAVALMAAQHPDVFRGRATEALVILIKNWILMGGE